MKSNILSPQKNQGRFFPLAKIAMLLFFSHCWRRETLNKKHITELGFSYVIVNVRIWSLQTVMSLYLITLWKA